MGHISGVCNGRRTNKLKNLNIILMEKEERERERTGTFTEAHHSDI